MDKEQLEDNKFHLNRKLIGTVVAFIIAASGLVILTNFSINMIAATGDYMSLLSTWSEQHQRSIRVLSQYARSGEQGTYEEYLKLEQNMSKPARAIKELFDTDPNEEIIFDSFSHLNAYPNEISSLILAFQGFRNSARVQGIHRQWQKLYKKEVEKREVARAIHEEWNAAQPDREQLDTYLATLSELTQDSYRYKQQLMAEVDQASVVIKRSGLWISVILGILLVLIGVVVTVRANKSIGRWEQALVEKEVLLSEIHHRVKNNLAVVSGLLELENMQDQDPGQALKDSRDRIQSMAMIHEVLYQSDSFSSINLSQYLHKLTNYIAETYIHEDKNISFDFHFENVFLNINQAVPVGLIVNEIIVNAITHGFDTPDDGEITLILSEIGEQVSLSIKDNGKGLPDDFNYETADSSGLMIVKTLVRQLRADINFKSEDGMIFNLQFQKSEASGSSNASL